MGDKVVLFNIDSGRYFREHGADLTPSFEEAHLYDADDPFVAQATRTSDVRVLPVTDAGIQRDSLPTSGDWLGSLTSAERKECAMSRGLLAYFPDALAALARHSVRMNEKHNPGEPVHWSRDKSSDHEDCIVRHSAAIAVNPDAMDDGQPEVICRLWRAAAAAQLWIEARRARGEKI